ncbi:TPA: hypothetical protein ACGO9M_000412 [Streptococcus suis]
MRINEGIGRENFIDQIVHLTGNKREEYSELTPYWLSMELKIAKIQAGLV